MQFVAQIDNQIMNPADELDKRLDRLFLEAMKESLQEKLIEARTRLEVLERIEDAICHIDTPDEPEGGEIPQGIA